MDPGDAGCARAGRRPRERGARDRPVDGRPGDRRRRRHGLRAGRLELQRRRRHRVQLRRGREQRPDADRPDHRHAARPRRLSVRLRHPRRVRAELRADVGVLQQHHRSLGREPRVLDQDELGRRLALPRPERRRPGLFRVLRRAGAARHRRRVLVQRRAVASDLAERQLLEDERRRLRRHEPADDVAPERPGGEHAAVHAGLLAPAAVDGQRHQRVDVHALVERPLRGPRRRRAERARPHLRPLRPARPERQQRPGERHPRGDRRHGRRVARLGRAEREPGAARELPRLRLPADGAASDGLRRPVHRGERRREGHVLWNLPRLEPAAGGTAGLPDGARIRAGRRGHGLHRHGDQPGSADQTGVTVTDNLPPNAQSVSATPSSGSCSGQGPITCNLGTVPAGGSATVTVNATPILPPTAVNVAAAQSDQASQVTNSKVVNVTAAPNTSYVGVTNTGFSTASPALTLGSTLQWSFVGPGSHSATDRTTGLGIFPDTGLVAPVAYRQTTFPGGGAYTFTDTATSKTIKLTVPMTAKPATGSTTATSGTFVPNKGAGTYKFRCRFRRTSGTGASAYTAAVSVTLRAAV